MARETFDDIIDFAVQREQEAVAFYKELQRIASFAPHKQLLKEFEGMERGHIKILEKIRAGGLKAVRVPAVADLRLADYLVAGAAAPDMSFQDILVFAMKKEEKAHALYTRLAEQSDDPAMETVFLKLASEEAKHKLHFETIYDDEVFTEN
jgi:rubrerythrin